MKIKDIIRFLKENINIPEVKMLGGIPSTSKDILTNGNIFYDFEYDSSSAEVNKIYSAFIQTFGQESVGKLFLSFSKKIEKLKNEKRVSNDINEKDYIKLYKLFVFYLFLNGTIYTHNKNLNFREVFSSSLGNKNNPYMFFEPLISAVIEGLKKQGEEYSFNFRYVEDDSVASHIVDSRETSIRQNKISDLRWELEEILTKTPYIKYEQLSTELKQNITLQEFELVKKHILFSLNKKISEDQTVDLREKTRNIRGNG